MFKRFIALAALALFPMFASAQTCNRIIDPRSGQVLKVECFDHLGRPISNGQVHVGGQQFAINNGQFAGCATRLSISFGGRDGQVNFGTCLAEMQSNPAVRTVYAQPNQGVRQQGQAGGGDNVTCNNCTINVNGQGATPSGTRTAKGHNCPDDLEPMWRNQDGFSRKVCVAFLPGSNAVRREIEYPN